MKVGDTIYYVLADEIEDMKLMDAVITKICVEDFGHLGPRDVYYLDNGDKINDLIYSYWESKEDAARDLISVCMRKSSAISVELDRLKARKQRYLDFADDLKLLLNEI